MAKILLVEDDKSLREIYGVRLQAEGYEIVSAGDGEEALAMAIKEHPDLIVSDVMMPKISGFDMLDILRSTTETKAIKVIMMTALSSDDQRARGEALGADRYLVKSQVGIEDVVRTVHDVLGDGVPGSTAAPTPSPFADPVPTAAAPTLMPTPGPINPAPVAPSAFTTPEPAPVVPPLPPITPTTPDPITAPTFTSPMPDPMANPVINAPVTPVTPAAPTPMPTPAPSTMPAPNPLTNPSTLPAPTAPFSTPRPQSLGDRVINPLTPQDGTPAPADIATLMNQELNATAVAPVAPPAVPPVPPAPPIPPVPGATI